MHLLAQVVFDDLRKIINTKLDKFIALSSCACHSPIRFVGPPLVVLFVLIVAESVSNMIDFLSGLSINMEAMMI